MSSPSPRRVRLGVAVLATAALSASMLSACSSDGGDGVALRSIRWGSDSRHSYTQEILERFEEEHPGINVEPEFTSWDDYWEKLSTSAAARDLPDVMQVVEPMMAGYWRIYFQILLPISVPALATTAIFTFGWTWNDFFARLIYLTKPEMQTAPVALRNFVDATAGASWGSLFAMSIVTLIPVFIVFLVGQRYLVKGVATTGLK